MIPLKKFGPPGTRKTTVPVACRRCGKTLLVAKGRVIVEICGKCKAK